MTNPNITPLTRTGKANFMLFGPPGVGKTTLIAGGQDTLILRPPTDHVDAAIKEGSSAQEWIVQNWEDMEEVEEYARHNSTAHRWIWLDSLSLFQDHSLESIMDRVIAEKPHRKDTPISPGEYGENMSKIKTWIRHMVGMPGFNFGLTAHPEMLGNNMGEEIKLRPWVQGKNMAFAICGYMNIVGYMEVVKERRVIRFAQTEQYDAKDQLMHLPKDRMVDPTMAKIEAALPKTNKTKPAAKRKLQVVRSK